MGVQGEHHGTSAAIQFAVTVLEVCRKGKARVVQLVSVFILSYVSFRECYIISFWLVCVIYIFSLPSDLQISSFISLYYG